MTKKQFLSDNPEMYPAPDPSIDIDPDKRVPAQSSRIWPDIKELHDAIADSLRHGLTYSSVRDAATAVQKLYAATLPQSGQMIAPEVIGRLNKIACWHVTEKPLWWQKEARDILASQPSPGASAPNDDFVEVVIACCNGQMGREAAIEVIDELRLAGFQIVPLPSTESHQEDGK